MSYDISIVKIGPLLRPVHMPKKPEKEKEETLLWQLAIHPDHPHHHIEIPFGIVGGLLAIVISFKFHQHRLSGYRAVMGRKIKNDPHYSHTHTHTHAHSFYGPLDFVQDYPGEPVPEPIWILLKQETVSCSGISWTICKSAPCPRKIMPAPHHSVFCRPDTLPAAHPAASKH